MQDNNVVIKNLGFSQQPLNSKSNDGVSVHFTQNYMYIFQSDFKQAVPILNKTKKCTGLGKQ